METYTITYVYQGRASVFKTRALSMKEAIRNLAIELTTNQGYKIREIKVS